MPNYSVRRSNFSKACNHGSRSVDETDRGRPLDPGPVRLGFVADEVTLGQVSLRELLFSSCLSHSTIAIGCNVQQYAKKVNSSQLYYRS